MNTQVTKKQAKEIVSTATDVAEQSATNPAAARAIEVANLLADDEAFNDDMEAAIVAEETRQRSPLYLMMDLRERLGEDAMAGLPVPESTEDDVKGTNNLPDWYATIVRDKDGIPKAGEQSFYQDLAETLPAGKAALSAIAALKEDTEINRVRGRAVLQSMVTTQNARLSRVKKALMTAVKLDKQLLAVNMLPGVGADYLTETIEENGEKVEKLLATNLPILIVNSAPKNIQERAQAKAVAITQFLAINLKKAEEMGGTFEAVMKAMERKKRAPRNEGTEAETDRGLEPFTTVPEAADALNELYAFLSDKEHYTPFMRRMAKPDEIGDDMTLTFGDFIQEIVLPWWTAEKDGKKFNQERYFKVAEAKANGVVERKAS